MSHIITEFTISDTSPAAAGTAVLDVAKGGFAKFDWLMIDAKIIGGTGGTTEIVIERQMPQDTDDWREWLRFPSVAAGATSYYTAQVLAVQGITLVGRSTTSTPVAPVLAVNTFVGGHPGDKIRVKATAGAGTSVGAAQLIYIQGRVPPL